MRLRALFVAASLAPLVACANTPSAEVEAEVLRREAFARAVSDDAGTALRWNVSGSADVVYADGFSVLLHDPPENVRSPAFRWMGQNSYVHLRTRGGRPHALRMLGWCHLKEIRAQRDEGWALIRRAWLDGEWEAAIVAS